MLRSLMAKLKFVNLLSPIAITATGSSTGVDTSLFGSLCLLVSVGAFAFGSGNTMAITLEESDTDVGSLYTTVATGDIYSPESGTIAKNLDGTDDQNAVYPIHYLGEKKYVRVTYTETGTVNCVLGVAAVEGHPKLMPPL